MKLMRLSIDANSIEGSIITNYYNKYIIVKNQKLFDMNDANIEFIHTAKYGNHLPYEDVVWPEPVRFNHFRRHFYGRNEN